jgi:16S rRNA (cytidine1402-2'-O)-methyltransferase
LLYLVALPIGNPDDITLRAIEVLKSVDLIASEDTRRTGRLLAHLGLKRPQVAVHEHNERRMEARLVELLREGQSIALVSDAGTPGISDPGFVLVRAAIREGLPVTALPGPTALIPALLLSGLPSHSFTFRGFPPRKPGRRKNFLAVDRDSPHTLIYYESPYRVAELVKAALEVFGDRPAALARELTKTYEEVRRGRLSELAAALEAEKGRPLGEFCLVIAGKDGGSDAEAEPEREGDTEDAEHPDEEM